LAPFNPQINPLNPDDYGRKSRPVDIDQGIKPQGVQTNEIMPHGVMQGDESAKYAGEAAAADIKSEAVGEASYANLFKDAVTTADVLGKAGVHMVKKDIENKVYEVADRERQSYTDLLEKIKAGQGVKTVLDANASMDEPDTPDEVAALPDRLAALQGARDSGKISGTYYQSNLLAEAKKLRAQYPGFREEIDQAFTKVTGSNPANAYIHSLVSDINRAATTQSSDRKRYESFILQNMDTIPNAPQVLHDFRAGLITPEEIVAKTYPYQKMKADLQMNDMLFRNGKNSREESERIAGQGVDKAIGMVVNQAADTISSKMGLNTQGDLDRLTSLQNAGQISPQQWQQWNQTVATVRGEILRTAIADADKHGYTQAVGGKAALIKKINDGLTPIDTIQDRITNKDFGGIFEAKNQISAINQQTQLGLLQDKKMGPYWQQLQATKELAGEQNLQKFTMDVIKGNFSEDYKNYFSRVQKEFASQTNMKTSGVPYTFNDTIDNLKANKVTDGKFNDAVMKEVNKVADKSLPEAIRENYALAAFSPGNRGMISRLQADGTDAKGRPVTGQTAVFQRFTSPEITKSMWELGQKNPEVWKQYTTWAKETLSNELMSKEIHDLAKVDTGATGVSVGWDAKNERFVTKYVGTPGPAESRVYTRNPAYERFIEGSVYRLNGNISNYKEIAKRTGEDTGAFILKSIADSAGPEVLRNVNGIPYNLMRDMGLARMNFMQNAR
jgi:hypothetical protein